MSGVFMMTLSTLSTTKARESLPRGFSPRGGPGCLTVDGWPCADDPTGHERPPIAIGAACVRVALDFLPRRATMIPCQHRRRAFNGTRKARLVTTIPLLPG